MADLKELNLRSLSLLANKLHSLTENRLWLKVIIGMFLGVLVGVLLGPDLKLAPAELSILITSWLALPGHLFLALIQMIVVPLVLASIICGLTAASSMNQLKRLGLYGGLFFLIMTIFASITGIFVAYLIDPGSYVDASLVQKSIGSNVLQTNPSLAKMPSIQELPKQVVGLLPSNPMQTFSTGDMLRIVIFALVFGIALMSLSKQKSSPLYDLLGSIQEVCMTIVGWAMKIAPLAVFGLIAQLTSTVGVGVLVGMLVYVFTVLAGLFIVATTYILIITFYSSIKTKPFIYESKEVLLMAFSTSSSAAVMPLTIKTLEQKLHINSVTVRFLIPLGATINMSGTALYQSIATIFLATIFGIELETTTLMLIVTMTIFASMGSPATPGASIAILAMMLDNIGIPQAGLALLLGVDRILDMARTLVNVLGDMAASIIVDKLINNDHEEHNVYK